MTQNETLKTAQPNMWSDGRRAYERALPRDGGDWGDAPLDAVAAYKAGWDEARDEAVARGEEPHVP